MPTTHGHVHLSRASPRSPTLRPTTPRSPTQKPSAATLPTRKPKTPRSPKPKKKKPTVKSLLKVLNLPPPPPPPPKRLSVAEILCRATTATAPPPPPPAPLPSQFKHGRGRRHMPIEEVRWLADLTGNMRIACMHMPASESEAMHARRYDGGRGETIYSRHAFSDHYPDPSEQPGGDPLRRSGAASIPSVKQRAAPAEPWYLQHGAASATPLVDAVDDILGFAEDDIEGQAAWLFEEWKPPQQMPSSALA